MPVIQLNEPTPPKIEGIVPFALGFRPFFFAAGVSATLLLVVWLLNWHGVIEANSYYSLIGWHSHEMLFGYGIAIIAGFLLTAVRNWTGQDTIVGKPLAALSAVWLAGRLLPFAHPLVPGALIALVDIAFIPLMVAALIGPLWKGENKINRRFIPLLLTMALANLLTHLQALGLADTAQLGTTLMLNMILLLLIFVAGRILPFFTENAIPNARTTYVPKVDQIGFYLIIALGLSQLLLPINFLVAALALALAINQGIRLYHWYDSRIWGIPILWILHTGYAWLVIGLLLTAAAQLDLFPANLAIHALTTGAVAVFTFGMMSRVALGHSGRPLQPKRIIELCYIAINLVPLLRVFGPLLLPAQYNIWVDVSGLIWIISFAIFCVVYLPILLRPRLDGRPG
ncbi:MAG: NnrS family protein [Candidatus Polarisedimenticolaceae bacterium]|nr:NnrS family protein [Candidatus Polarisedimenticolaceae bacterium]